MLVRPRCPVDIGLDVGGTEELALEHVTVLRWVNMFGRNGT